MLECTVLEIRQREEERRISIVYRVSLGVMKVE